MTEINLEKVTSGFDQFMAAVGRKNPRERSIMKVIKKELLNFKIYTLISLFMVHALTGANVIAICPQFDFCYFQTFGGLLTSAQRTA